jgi:hypothetical protein
MPDFVMVDVPLVIAVAHLNRGGVGTSDVYRGKGGGDATRRWLRVLPHHHHRSNVRAHPGAYTADRKLVADRGDI